MVKESLKLPVLPTADFAAALLAWYDRAAADLPWRQTRDAYHIWLSEIMLQQTRVATVESYYQNFLAAFPNIHTLAAAPLDAVIKQWEGLGYYSRARNLRRAAQTIVNDCAGQFPASSEILQKLPGIGAYTAAAIASIAFNEPVAALDGNVLRILTRLYDYAEAIHKPAAAQQLGRWAQGLLAHARPGDFNQAMMDLGRTICLPRNPLCAQCPVQTHCQAFAHKTQSLRPVKKQKAPLLAVRAAVAVIRDNKKRLLLAQRPPSGLLGGLWTLPGGDCESDESCAAALHRILPVEFGVQISVQQEMASAKQTFTHFHLNLHAFACEITAGRAKVKSPRRLAWVKPDELNQYSFGKADRAILDALAQWQPRLFEE